ncbi:MAG TPA: menaquinone reductase integral membrane subunit QrcD [Thermoanaerobaculia bacterium]
MDKPLILRGVSRCSTRNFAAWLFPWVVLLAVGLFAIGLCLIAGLNQTNMDNRFAFGLWIFLDLAVIALGAGAFFTGFLLYILRRDELRAVINSAVVLGFICYSGAVLILMVDVGQPLRAWFTFWHPNPHSMLAEVTFCITVYLTVLAIEYVPILLKNRQLRKVPSFLAFEFQLHKVMPVFAAVGAFLSFFHQGSLGGLYGVLQGRPFAFREGFAIWPSTFFLFILSAIATGPAFVLLTTWMVSVLTRKRLVEKRVLSLLAKISGWLLIVYVGLKSIDTLVWLNHTAISTGTYPIRFFAWQPFDVWVLVAEIVLLGLVPALIFLSPSRRQSTAWLVTGSVLACGGVVLNRLVMTIQTLAVPTLKFEPFLMYWPNWQEVAAFVGVVAYGVILYSLSFRYLTLFPQERDLQQR